MSGSSDDGRLDSLLAAIGSMRVFELGLSIDHETPHLPAHPPVMHRLIRRHGDVDLGDHVSAAADMITMGLHTGTHIDAIGHISQHRRLHGDEAAQIAEPHDRLGRQGIDELAPFMGRGVLLDVAKQRGVLSLGPKEAVTPHDLDACLESSGLTIRAGDAVLIRTGWSTRMRSDRAGYIGQPGGVPGVGLDAARWLGEREVTLAGADVPTFEPMPTSGVPAHVELLVRRGIPIVECLDLDALAQASVYVFLLILIPLRITGGTASPIRPLALSLPS